MVLSPALPVTSRRSHRRVQIGAAAPESSDQSPCPHPAPHYFSAALHNTFSGFRSRCAIVLACKIPQAVPTWAASRDTFASSSQPFGDRRAICAAQVAHTATRSAGE